MNLRCCTCRGSGHYPLGMLSLLAARPITVTVHLRLALAPRFPAYHISYITLQLFPAIGIP